MPFLIVGASILYYEHGGELVPFVFEQIVGKKTLGLSVISYDVSEVSGCVVVIKYCGQVDPVTGGMFFRDVAFFVQYEADKGGVFIVLDLEQDGGFAMGVVLPEVLFQVVEVIVCLGSGIGDGQEPSLGVVFVLRHAAVGVAGVYGTGGPSGG